jgi:hypothetical protein
MQVLFINSEIEVCKNDSGEIFIKNIKYPKSQLRIIPQYNGSINITCYSGTLIPTSVNQLSAIRAVPGKVKWD